MKKNLLLTSILALLLASCSFAPQRVKKEGEIDIVSAFENQTELKVSQLGKTIRYVPLETNDSSLVGGAWNIHLLDDKILVSCKEANMLFDRQTGMFLCKVSGVGQGPQEYTQGNYTPYIHPQTGDIYFNRTPNKMIGFNQEGKFIGELALPVNWHDQCYLTFDDDQAILHVMSNNQRLYRFGADAQVTDSIVLPSFGREIVNDDFLSASHFVANSGKMFGLGIFSCNGMLVAKYKSGERMDLIPTRYPSLYHYHDEIRFHEACSDTVFSIEGNQLSPRWIFHTGEYHFPMERYGEMKESLNYIAVTYAVENDRILFFQCAKGLFSGFKEVQLCNAIYQKKDGTLLMNNAKEGFTDDLTHFMPFHPEDFTQKGEYIGALNVVKIQKWLEAHPETKLEGALAPLAGLADDANPVVVIVEP